MSDPTPHRDPVVHELKIWPGFFVEVMAGRKTHEVRKADRDFQIGDTLWLREWQSATAGLHNGEWKTEPERYTGREIRARVTAMTDPGTFGLPKDVCVMSIDIAAYFEDDRIDQELDGFLRKVASRTKHGRNESGEAGPCEPDCVKCTAERLLQR